MDGSKREQFLERCYAQSKRLTNLLRDISTLNRLDDATEMFEFEKVDINSIISQIEKETALEMERRHMTIKMSIPENIVVTGSPGMI